MEYEVEWLPSHLLELQVEVVVQQQPPFHLAEQQPPVDLASPHLLELQVEEVVQQQQPPFHLAEQQPPVDLASPHLLEL